MCLNAILPNVDWVNTKGKIANLTALPVGKKATVGKSDYIANANDYTEFLLQSWHP